MQPLPAYANDIAMDGFTGFSYRGRSEISTLCREPAVRMLSWLTAHAREVETHTLCKRTQGRDSDARQKKEQMKRKELERPRCPPGSARARECPTRTRRRLNRAAHYKGKDPIHHAETGLERARLPGGIVERAQSKENNTNTREENKKKKFSSHQMHGKGAHERTQ